MKNMTGDSNTMTKHHNIQKFEKKLRVLKGEGYKTMGRVVGTRLETESGEYPDFEDDESLDNVVIGIGVETDEGRRVMTKFSPPSVWDLVNELVVILEYLDLEPEQFHELDNREYEVPVTFDESSETYHLDFQRMRDVLIENDE